MRRRGQLSAAGPEEVSRAYLAYSFFELNCIPVFDFALFVVELYSSAFVIKREAG